MKKIRIIGIILTLAICFSMASCGVLFGQDEGEKIEDAVKEDVRLEAIAQFAVSSVLSDDGRTFLLCECTSVKENSDGTYDAYGYVTFKNSYGDKYKTTFKAVASVEDSGEVDVDSFEFVKTTKQ